LSFKVLRLVASRSASGSHLKLLARKSRRVSSASGGGGERAPQRFRQPHSTTVGQHHSQ
jgi:hypothetical protein